MYTELGDLDNKDDKENTPGTKLFTVSKDTEAFLKHHFTARFGQPSSSSMAGETRSAATTHYSLPQAGQDSKPDKRDC